MFKISSFILEFANRIRLNSQLYLHILKSCFRPLQTFSKKSNSYTLDIKDNFVPKYRSIYTGRGGGGGVDSTLASNISNDLKTKVSENSFYLYCHLGENL